VIDLFDHKDGHLFLKLKDDSGGVVSVPIFSRTRAGLNETIELLDQVKVTGIVDEYQGELEVVPDKAEDIKITHAAPAPLSDLGQENLGELVKVEGTISEREVVGSGNLILTLQEDGHKLSVFVPQWVVTDGLPELHTGYKIRVTGWVQLYENELEVRLKEAPHLRVVTE
jgi:DNA/RNA endonuclease YhcR with UshA esterase domain